MSNTIGRRVGVFLRVLVFSAAFLFVTPGWAYLVNNSSLTNNLDHWTQVGNWVHNPAAGIDPGSAETTSTAAGSSSLHQCTDLTNHVPAHRGLYAFGFGRALNHSNAILVSLELYNSSDCSGPAVDTQQRQIFPPQDTWVFMYTVGTAPPGPQRSARLWITAFSDAPGQTTRVDLMVLTHNLPFNPDFNDGIDVWADANNDWTHEPNDGYGSPNGAARLEVPDIDCGAGNDCSFLAQCLSLDLIPNTGALFSGAAFKALDNVDTMAIAQLIYPEPGCTGELLFQAGAEITLTQVGVWQRVGGSFEVPPGAVSVLVLVGINDGTPGDEFLADSIYLAPPANLGIFLDGFEDN